MQGLHVAWKGAYAPSQCVTHCGAAWGPTLKWPISLFSAISLSFFTFLVWTPILPFSLLSLISCDPGLRLTIRLRLRVIQVSAFPLLPFFSVLNRWNVLYWLLSLYVFLLSSCAFSPLFSLISHAIVCFGMVYTLSKHVSAQKLHLCIEICTRTNG